MWTKAGTVGVDAGCVTIGDPCYVVGKGQTWDEFCADLLTAGFDDHDVCKTQSDHIVVHSGYGDGEYPVYVQKTGGRVVAATVVFIPESFHPEGLRPVFDRDVDEGCGSDGDCDCARCSGHPNEED